MLAHYSSNTNRFIQRPNLILHACITLVVGSPASSVDVFDYPPSVSIKRIFK